MTPDFLQIILSIILPWLLSSQPTTQLNNEIISIFLPTTPTLLNLHDLSSLIICLGEKRQQQQQQNKAKLNNNSTCRMLCNTGDIVPLTVSFLSSMSLFSRAYKHELVLFLLPLREIHGLRNKYLMHSLAATAVTEFRECKYISIYKWNHWI